MPAKRKGMANIARQLQAHDHADDPGCSLAPFSSQQSWPYPLVRYTLNSGHYRPLLFQPNALTLIPLLSSVVRETHRPVSFGGPYRFWIRRSRGMAASFFTLDRAGLPLIVGAVCWHDSASAVWEQLRRLYQPLRIEAGAQFGQMHPCAPLTLPWLGVVLFPAVAHERVMAVERLARFERWLAWAILAVYWHERN